MMQEKIKLFFGTANAHKLEEIKQILGDEFEIKSFLDLPSVPELEETETTLDGNAILKAMNFFHVSGMPCFADDTGLEVDALEGAPGVYSARYAGPGHDASANMDKLLNEMQGKEDRRAKFRTVIAYFDGKMLKTFEGILKGTVAHLPVGTGGFGYDPIFIPEGSERTLGQYPPEEKAEMSHRARAMKKFVEYVKITKAGR